MPYKRNTSVKSAKTMLKPSNLQESITCPECGQVSYNQKDIENEYCALCGYHAKPITHFFIEQGYENPQFIKGWGWCALNRFMFTYGVLHGMTKAGYKGRFCFDTRGNAKAFYDDLIKHGKNVPLPVVGVDGCTAIK